MSGAVHNSPTAATRYEREAAFHDSEAATSGREAADKYYSISERSRRWFGRFIETRGKGQAVLEYGCGLSGFWYSLVGKATSITGIDISRAAIDQASSEARRLNVANVRFLQMNAERMDFPDSSFGLVFGLGILHHLDLDRSLSELARTMTPDGSAIFLEPMGHNPLINLYRRRTPQMRTADEHPLLIQDIQRARQYFGSVEAHFYHLFSLLAVPLRGRRAFPRVLNFLDDVDATLFRVVPQMARYAWMVSLVLSQPKKK